jgi:hypothetical protein
MPDTPVIARAELGGGLSVGLRVLVGDRHTDLTPGGRRKANRGGPLHAKGAAG